MKIIYLVIYMILSYNSYVNCFTYKRLVLSNNKLHKAYALSNNIPIDVSTIEYNHINKKGHIFNDIRAKLSNNSIINFIKSIYKTKKKKLLSSILGIILIIFTTFNKSTKASEIFKMPTKSSTKTSTKMSTKFKSKFKKQKRNIEIIIDKNIKKFNNFFHIDDKNPSINTIEEEIKSLTMSAIDAETEAVKEVARSWESLSSSLKGVKQDSLFLLIVTSIIVPLFKKLKLSPIIGFLLTGTLLGPSGLNFVDDIHMIDVLGELGIVFFLFEMGLELSLERLNKMKRDVFGLGTLQYIITALVGTSISLLSGLSPAASVTIGGSLSLSSSAFVLQLLKDKNAMGTRHGKASFGILLLQDLAVVPLLVIVELLAKGGAGLGKALSVAGIKAFVALSTMSYVGRRILNPIFYAVAKSSSQEAFLSIILSTVLLMSFVTKGIGLSDTLGAFLAGLLLAETKYRYQIEADISPFRGLLLGVFFITVGFSIDLNLLVNQTGKVVLLLVSLLTTKTIIISALCLLFGLSLSSSLQCGLLNSQGGEFAFVALGIAEKSALIPASLSKLLLTTVALSMAVTPIMAEISSIVASKLEKTTDIPPFLSEGTISEQVDDVTKDSFVFVCGYGRVGKMICDMLDRMFIRYVAVDSNVKKVSEARAKGLPVFFGDVTRAEVLKTFDVGSAQACVIAFDDITITNRSVMILRKLFTDLPILVRAKNMQHQRRLESMFDNVYAMSPVLPDDSVLLTLPFGGAVLQNLGVSRPEIDAILEDFRRIYIDDKELDDDSIDFLNSFRRRLPPSVTVNIENIDLNDSDSLDLPLDSMIVSKIESTIDNKIDSKIDDKIVDKISSNVNYNLDSTRDIKVDIQIKSNAYTDVANKNDSNHTDNQTNNNEVSTTHEVDIANDNHWTDVTFYEQSQDSKIE